MLGVIPEAVVVILAVIGTAVIGAGAAIIITLNRRMRREPVRANPTLEMAADRFSYAAQVAALDNMVSNAMRTMTPSASATDPETRELAALADLDAKRRPARKRAKRRKR